MNVAAWLFFVMLRFSTADAISADIWEEWVPLSEYNLFPTLPIASPFSEDKNCREESRQLILGLKNKTLWAMQMWDSSATTTFGALHGNKYHFGNYDECLAVTKPIRARYCEAKIKASVHAKEAFEGDFYELNPDPNATVWRKFQNSRRDHTQYARDESQWGLCVPFSCNSTEMEKAINSYLSRLNERFLKTNGTTYEVEIPENYCFDGNEEALSYGEMGFWVFTWLLLILIGIATSIDLGKKKELFVEESKLKGYLMKFSLKRNVLTLMKRDEGGKKKETNILYGIRFYNVCYIVTDHRMGILLSTVIFNSQKFEEDFRSWLNIILPHGDLLVDTYFFIGGYLATLNLFHIYRVRFYNPVRVIIHRFCRLAPLYFYIIWFQATVFLRFGSGPAWKIGLKDEVEFCRKNWWANLLFIQNYVNAKEMCMLHAWYLPCDMHFFILAVFLIILLKKNRAVGFYVLHILTFIAILIPGIVTYIHELQPILAFNPKFVDKPRLDPSFEYLYVKSHTRVAVYLMGILTAYHLFERRNSNWKISKRTSILTCFLGLGFLFSPMVYGSLYYNPRKKYNLAESVTFAILRRFSWGLGWVLFMVVNRFGVIPIFGKVFSWKISVPLSKTTYAIYLIHFLIQMADEAKAKIPYQFISFEMVSHLVICIVDSFTFTVRCFEHYQYHSAFYKPATFIPSYYLLPIMLFIVSFLLFCLGSALSKWRFILSETAVFVKGTNDLFFATGYAFVLYLIIELPFRLIFKELLFPVLKKKSVSPPESNQSSTKVENPHTLSVKL